MSAAAIKRWAECWSAHDLEGLLLLFTDDVVYEDVPMGAVNRGNAEVRAFAASVLSHLPDITFEPNSMFTDGTMGGAEWIMRGTRNGRRAEVHGVSIFEFAGERIRRCSDYWDMATYLKQLGA